MTLDVLFSLSDNQKIEAFERIANIYMCTVDPVELDRDITLVIESYTKTIVGKAQKEGGKSNA